LTILVFSAININSVCYYCNHHLYYIIH